MEQKKVICADEYAEFIRIAENVTEKAKNSGCIHIIIYLDTNGFQSVNNFYGFMEGDRFLEALSGFLSDYKGTKVCNRVFSDNFLILMEFEKKGMIADAMHDFKVALNNFLDEQEQYHSSCNVHAAGGYCVVQDEEDRIPRAIDYANIARKEAKSSLCTELVWFDESMGKKLRQRKNLELCIVEALQQKEFTFFLQPKVNLSNGRIVAAEALARWIRPDGTMIYPDEFIPVMEQNGTITELDFQIYEKVCQYLHECMMLKKPVVPISVNMSRVNINIRGVADHIHNIASSYRIPPYLLEFELTETVLMNDFDCAKEFMNHLRANGYKTSIDDFGAGFTGINVWRELNFDVVKLDKNFVSDDEKLQNKNDLIVSSVSYMGKNTNTTLLCEGVETFEQCYHMKNLGCEIAQGYCFSKPISVEIFEQYLIERKGYFPIPWSNEQGSEDWEKFINVASKEGRQKLFNRYHVVMQLMEIDVWCYDYENGCVSFETEKKHCPIFPSDRIRFTQKEVLKIVHPQDREQLKDLLRATTIKDNCGQLQLRLKTLTGEYQWFQMVYKISETYKGQVKEITGILEAKV